MAGQEQIRPSQGQLTAEGPGGPEGTSAQIAARKASLDADIDAVLADIDEVLEANAEEFVRGFVQKGGQ
ncbi:Prokaryotic ubiquitin-like protein Pup [Austwickia sp. TVS 96-490-7B]|uniref:ubiquitin-like protein Pup n=1 Tax=Austwickia sp. TVS 96-490-7B TaxID=2830843 RepID=UPI001C57906E|nr:ubiquitin-like protein Pup [Austwickia sp. TVS 96-490-7B]MBW3085397.1 Prokaryotic ubiquitin-like protein Pup [Austwickia sp. TVS 96-490-7B]